MIYDYNDSYTVIEVRFEKYRSIDDPGEDLEPEEVDRIVAMQSIHSSILEYLYQQEIAEQTQLALCEAAYTAFVTAVSTAIALPISYGINYLGKLGGAALAGSTATTTGASAVTETAKVSTLIKALKYVKSVGSWIGKRYLLGICSEILEEIYVDPLIESIVANMAEDLGLNAYWQSFWATFASTFRETGAGAVARPFVSALNLKVDTLASSLPSTEQDAIMEIQQLKSEIKMANLRSSLVEGLSTGLMFAAPILGGTIGGIFGMGLSTGLVLLNDIEISSSTLFDKLARLEALEKLHSQLSSAHPEPVIPDMSYNPLEGLLPSMDYEFSDIEKALWHAEMRLASVEHLNPRLEEQASRKMAERTLSWRKMFTGTYEWFKSHKSQALASIAPIGLGLLNPAMLVVGGTITAVSLSLTFLAKRHYTASERQVISELTRSIVLEQLEEYSRTGTRPYSLSQATAKVGLKTSSTATTYIKNSLKEIFRSIDKAQWIYDMIFGYIKTSYQDLRRRCEKADVDLITTPTEWFDMMKDSDIASAMEKYVMIKHRDCGHYDLKRVENIGKRGCDECRISHIAIQNLPQTLDIEKILEVAKVNNLELISTDEEIRDAIKKARRETGRNTEAEFRWKCKDCGHIFPARYSSVAYKTGSCPAWGPITSQSVCHRIAEYLFGQAFEVNYKLHRIFSKKYIPKILSHYNVHIDSFGVVKIDGREIKLAIEYHGKQHEDTIYGWRAYLEITHGKGTYADWRRMIKRDQEKVNLFKSKNKEEYFLIVVPHSVKKRQMFGYILRQFESQTGIKLNRRQLNWKTIYYNYRITKFL